MPLLFAGMLCTSFYTYASISLSLITIVRNLTPLVTLPIESFVMPPDKRPTINATVILSIFVMLVGATMYCGDLPKLSTAGIGFAALNMSLAVTDRIVQRRLLTQECQEFA